MTSKLFHAIRSENIWGPYLNGLPNISEARHKQVKLILTISHIVLEYNCTAKPKCLAVSLVSWG